MLRSPLAIVLAVTMSCATFAQEPTPTEVATRLVGSPVYSSDAQKVGQVTAIDLGADGRVTGLQAEISGFLGLGSSSVHLGASEFESKGDRIVLSKTADQVTAY
jgi:sporulation protein YlmC with PRC-barrel domain